MRKTRTALLLSMLLGFSAFTTAALADAPLTNADVLRMVEAKLPESTIVLAIRGSEARFDVAPDALISLSRAGVPAAVVDAMIQKSQGASGTAAAAGGDWNPEEIVLREDGKETVMRYMPATFRTAARGMGFGGVGMYAVLNGAAANLRLSSNRPTFIIAVPGNAQPESYLTLANFAVRRNNTREVSVGGGYMSYSTGIARDRIVQTEGKPLADQSRAPKGYVLFEISPKSPLPPGEYALITYNSQVKTLGFFASGTDSYFDFGVD